jgi:hypothetical protein
MEPVGSATLGSLDRGYLMRSNDQAAGQIYIGLVTTNNVLARRIGGSY